MKKISTLILATVISVALFSQTSIPNGGFETWTGSGATIEPTNFNSNRTGTGLASSGPQTCFQDASIKHSGTYSARVETINYLSITAVNGALTSGIVNAPTANKADGYIGTMQGASGTDIRRISFVGRPDSIIGFYQYVQSTSTSGTGGANERGKVYAILHVGNYYDPSAASGYHPDSSANKIAEALFLTPMSNVSSWTRFSVPFTYYDSRTPQYIMINMTSSNNQLTSVAGSKIWLDDISVVYNPTVGVSNIAKDNFNIYNNNNILYVESLDNSESNFTVKVLDLTGKLVMSKNISQTKSTSVDLSELSKGMYLYQVTGKDINKSGKIIIE